MGWLRVPEVQSIIIMAGSMASIKTDMVLEKELRVLHLRQQKDRLCAILGVA